MSLQSEDQWFEVYSKELVDDVAEREGSQTRNKNEEQESCMQNLLLPAELHAHAPIVVHVDQLRAILLKAQLKVQSIRINYIEIVCGFPLLEWHISDLVIVDHHTACLEVVACLGVVKVQYHLDLRRSNE